MNILFLTPQIPYPPRQGTALRNWGLLRHVAGRHEVTLLSFASDASEAIAPELRAACRQIVAVPAPRRGAAQRLRTLLSPQADLARRLWSSEFDRALAGVLASAAFDFAHLEGLEMAAYLPRLLAAASRPRVIYDAHNVEHVLQQRACRTDLGHPARWPAALYSWAQVPRLRRLEARTCAAVDHVVCVSEADAGRLRRLAPDSDVTVVANGLDLGDYTPRTGLSASHEALIFTGKMDYRPNVDAVLWFAESILPHIRRQRPAARFTVVGQSPPPAVRARLERQGVAFTGAVPDTRPLVRDAAVYVAPLRMGGGTRFKLLEAMALGRPVVSTTVGAEGFDVRPGADLVLADSPADFAEAVCDLLANPARARSLGAAGRVLVEAQHDWRAIVPRLEAVYARAAGP